MPKIKEKLLNKLQELIQENGNLRQNIGDIFLTKERLLNELKEKQEEVTKKLEKNEKRLEDLKEDLQDKYGDVSIDVVTGEYQEKENPTDLDPITVEAIAEDSAK